MSLRKLLLMVFLIAPLLAILTGSAAALQAQGTQERPHRNADSQPVSHKEPQITVTPDPPGIFDQSLTIKGTGISLQFGGYVKVDFIQDLDPIGNKKQFLVNSIPVLATDPDFGLGGNTNIQANQTRFSVDVRGDTSTGQVRGFFEVDFFGSGGTFRLRHAYGEWKGLLGGQTWTTFMDVPARPHMLDFEGPDSGYFTRHAMIRYTGKPSEKLEWSVAVEDPQNNQITLPTGVTGTFRNEVPDLVGRVLIEPNWGHIQVAGIVRQLRFVSDGGLVDEKTTGYGLGLSGKSKVGERDAIMGLVGFGSGVAHYVTAFNKTPSDAVLTPAGELEAIDYLAVMLAYEHHWNNRLFSSIGVGHAIVYNKPSQPDDALRSISSPHFNLIYRPNRLLEIGGEVMWGRRKNKDGNNGDATRLQFSIQYKFR